MEHEIFEAMKRIESLLKDSDLCNGEEEIECLDRLYLVIRDSIRYGKLIHYLMRISKRLPFDVILDLNDIAELDPINRIEREWEVPGFNDWYKEWRGITVEEASSEKEGPQNDK